MIVTFVTVESFITAYGSCIVNAGLVITEVFAGAIVVAFDSGVEFVMGVELVMVELVALVLLSAVEFVIVSFG